MSNWRPILPVPAGVKIVIPRHPLGDPSAGWEYRDAQRRLLFITCRFDLVRDGAAAKIVLPLCWCENDKGAKAWGWKAPPALRPLYGLDKLAARPDTPVLVCEGEKTADAAAQLFSDHVTVTSQGGCKAATTADWSQLAGRRVVIWPDHDEPGSKYAANVGRLAHAAGAAVVRIVAVPNHFPPKWDLADAPPEGWEP